MIIMSNIRQSYLIRFLLSIFALTSCSQKVAETNDVADDITIADADSIAHVIESTIPAEADAVDNVENDSVVLGNVIVVAESLIQKKGWNSKSVLLQKAMNTIKKRTVLYVHSTIGAILPTLCMW